jgi:plastocyanin
VKIIAAALAAALLLAGCTGSGSDESPRDRAKEQADAQASQRAEAQQQLEEKVSEEAEAAGAIVEIVIKDGKVAPRGDRVEVKVGQKVTLDITSDAHEQIHVHSEPEHEYEVGPGDTVTKSFTLDTPGQVAVEAHHLDATIVQLVVRP